MPAAAPADGRPPLEGFGAHTPGGAGKPVYRVTSLEDSGAGTLRDALSRGNRTIVFDVAGTIELRSVVVARGSFITVDGFSAPSPGITLRNDGIRLFGNLGAHDVVIRGIRIRDSGRNGTSDPDGVNVKFGAYNVVIDHVSLDGCGDGNIDITRGAHDVTVQYSILSNCPKNVLIKYEASRISMHHNLFASSRWRNPNIAHTDEFLPNVAPEITTDFRNNLIWQWGNRGGGTILQCGAKANLVNNFYFSPGAAPKAQTKAIVDSGCPRNASGRSASFHTAGNLSGDALVLDLNRLGNEPNAFPAAAVTFTDACDAARRVLAEAGVHPRDLTDRKILEAIPEPCPAPPVGSVAETE